MFNEDVKELNGFLNDPKICDANKEEILRRNIAYMIMAAQDDKLYREEVLDYLSSVEV